MCNPASSDEGIRECVGYSNCCDDEKDGDTKHYIDKSLLVELGVSRTEYEVMMEDIFIAISINSHL